MKLDAGSGLPLCRTPQNSFCILDSDWDILAMAVHSLLCCITECSAGCNKRFAVYPFSQCPRGAVFLLDTAKSVGRVIHTSGMINNSLLFKKLEQTQDYICNNFTLSCVLLYSSQGFYEWKEEGNNN